MAQGPVRETLATIIDHFAGGGPAYGQPAVAWGVVVDGDLVLSGGSGALRVAPDGSPDGPPPDADSVFRIASMTKSFTATALLALRDAGAIALDDPVARYVPELEGLRPATADSPVLTLRHLMTMSGGLPTDDPWGDRQQALALDAFGDLLRGGLTFAWAPGTAFEYSNLGYAILGRAIATVTGEDYAAAVRRLVLDPLGLASTVFDAADADPARLATGYRRSPLVEPVTTSAGVLAGSGQLPRVWQEVPFDPYGAFAPMGGLFSSVRDLATWVGGFLDAFPPRDDAEGGHPLCRASRREMQQQHRVIPPRLVGRALDDPPVARASGYGYGLVADLDHRDGYVVGHSGGYPGFGSHMRWHPESGMGVVVLASSTYARSAVTAQGLLLGLLDAGRDAVLAAAGTSGRRPAAAAPVAPSVRPALVPAAPAPCTPSEATLAAMRTVEGLLTAWDDDVVAALVAENIDLDEPLAVRRERFAQAAALAGDGVLVRDASTPSDHDAPTHAQWWLRGPLGRVRLEIRLTPHPVPLLQTLSVTPVPEPSGALLRLVETYADLTAFEVPTWPPGVPVSASLRVAGLEEQLRTVSAIAGPCAVGPVVDGDGVRTTTVLLDGATADLELTLVVDRAGALLRATVVHPEPTLG